MVEEMIEFEVYANLESFVFGWNYVWKALWFYYPSKR